MEDGGSAARRRFDIEAVHEPPRAQNAQPHAGAGRIFAAQNALQIANAGAAIQDADEEDLGRRLAFHHELDTAAARVLKRIAGDLRNRRGQPGLLLRVEAQQRRDLAGALARGHHVLFVSNFARKNRQAHSSGLASCATTTVTSSWPRI